MGEKVGLNLNLFTHVLFLEKERGGDRVGKGVLPAAAAGSDGDGRGRDNRPDREGIQNQE